MKLMPETITWNSYKQSTKVSSNLFDNIPSLSRGPNLLLRTEGSKNTYDVGFFPWMKKNQTHSRR